MYNKVCILTIYRSPKGNFKNFLKQLDLILQKLYDNKHNIIICGDVNVNYLLDNKDKSQLNAVLHSYNLSSTVTFPTRIGLNSHTAIDSVLIDISSIGKYDLYPLTNGISDHDAQLLIINMIQKQIKGGHTYFKRNINEYTIADFQLNLSHETWELVFNENDVNKTFNVFLNIFLRIYYSSFPLIQARKNINQNSRITPGIINSCKHKTDLYKQIQNNNNPIATSHYKKYSKLLTVVIKKAK
jgi:hypothetical protein